MDEKHLGWTNKETWIAYNMLANNEQKTYEEAIKLVNGANPAKKLKDLATKYFLEVYNAFNDTEHNSVDNSDSKINWDEVVVALKEE